MNNKETWITLENGTHLLIKDGQSVEEAIEENFTDDYEEELKKEFEFKYNKDDEYFNQYEMKSVDLKQLAKDNDLYNNDALNYHENVWGNDADKYKFDESKMDINNPPRIRERNGKLIISDGRHRIRALLNNGYTHAKLLKLKGGK